MCKFLLDFVVQWKGVVKSFAVCVGGGEGAELVLEFVGLASSFDFSLERKEGQQAAGIFHVRYDQKCPEMHYELLKRPFKHKSKSRFRQHVDRASRGADVAIQWQFHDPCNMFQVLGPNASALVALAQGGPCFGANLFLS